MNCISQGSRMSRPRDAFGEDSICESESHFVRSISFLFLSCEFSEVCLVLCLLLSDANLLNTIFPR